MGKRRRFNKIKNVDPFAPQNKEKKEKRERKLNLKQKVPRKFTEMMEMKELYEGKSERAIKRELRERMKNDNQFEMQEKKKKSQDAERKTGESHYRHMARLTNEVTVAVEKARGSLGELPEKEMGEPSAKKMKIKKRLQTLKDKRRHKTQKKMADKEEKDRWVDHVEFGEVVMRPPTLSSKPRKAEDNKKPGQRDLLLKNFFTTSKKSSISMARAKLLNDERDRVIQAYRDMKKKNE